MLVAGKTGGSRAARKLLARVDATPVLRKAES